MTPAQPEAQVLYRTLAWCAAASGASNAEQDQYRALHMRGKCSPQTGNNPRDPHQPGIQLACYQVLRVARGERCTTGPMGCRPVQGSSHDAGEGLLRNQKMRSYHFHTDSETEMVTIKPGCGDATAALSGTGASTLQGVDH